jgi:hypothetical protein
MKDKKGMIWVEFKFGLDVGCWFAWVWGNGLIWAWG